MNSVSKLQEFARAKASIFVTALAIGVAVVALVQPVASVAGKAAQLITGKDIKNRSIKGKDIKKGTIKLKHLTPAARQKALTTSKGAQGTKGKTGKKGKTGSKGATGKSGVSGLEMVSTTNVVSSDQVATTLSCPSSKKLVDGGYSIEGTTEYGSIAVVKSLPVSSGNTQTPDSYSVQAVETQPVADSWSLTVTATCATAG